MSYRGQWLFDFAGFGVHPDPQTSLKSVEGLVAVAGYVKAGRSPEEVAVMEKAAHYGSDAVFFEAAREGRPPVAQAFIYRSEGPATDAAFAERHKQLWSWGGVPIVFRVTQGLVQLFRCAHGPDFEVNGQVVFRPFQTLDIASQIAADPWWDAHRLRNGTLWDDPNVCQKLLSGKDAAQKTLIDAVKDLHQELDAQGVLSKSLRRRLLILSVLIAYLEARNVFESDFFSQFRQGAQKFFEVLADGNALVALLERLEQRFNGHVFILNDQDREMLCASTQLRRLARLIEGRQEPSGQLSLWERYSFADLPVELISHVYQLFVDDAAVAVYTPHFLVRLMLGEVLTWDRLDRLAKNDEFVLDGACGSGIFLVEAYKRIVLHWRYRNDWKRPNQTILKKLLTNRVRGIDIEEGAVELSAFSLCLALCDALEPAEIRASVKLFPALKEKSIQTACFFDARERELIKGRVGVIVGNPPFTSVLRPGSEQKAYERYQASHGRLPDKQLAYLFLHESMEMLVPGGVLALLQQYNFLYNQKSKGFRNKFIQTWDVREIFDFISVRGLFKKGGADTKVVVVVAEAKPPPKDRQILHATFRRTGRIEAEQGFDIDYYDMHWLPREMVLDNDAVWRSDLLGGGRVLKFVDRLRKFRTLGKYAEEQGWDYGEGYVEGASGVSRPAQHVNGKPLLPSTAISESGIDSSSIRIALTKPIEGPRTEKRFTPPMLLVREHMDLFRGIWTKHYLTYKNKIVGFCGISPTDIKKLEELSAWMDSENVALRAFVAAISVRLFTQKATTLSGLDIEDLPYPSDHKLNIAAHEKILAADIVDYYRDLVRLGEDSAALKKPGVPALPAFNDIFTARINGVYKKNKLRALNWQAWPGVICQPYAFGTGKVDWGSTDELKGKVDALLRERLSGGLNVTRIARLYDGACVYLLKPDRLRYWLRSIALRDADEMLADLSEQGF